MPRKSQAKRLEEGRALSILYTEAGLTTSWEYGFLASVIEQMERGKYPTKRQRTRFDDLITEGVPQPKGDQKLLAQIDGAIEYWSTNPDRDWDTGVLRDLRRNVFKGWDLSEKQKGLLDKLLQRFEDDKSGKNDFTPTDEQVDDLRLLSKIYYGYAHNWQADRPALAKAVDRVVRYLRGEASIEEYHYNKVMKAMGTRLKRVKDPRFKKGDLSQARQWDRSVPGEPVVIVCMSDVYINEEGEIVNDWMVPSAGIRQYAPDQLPKRLKK
jgi:hypothetical protein